ncbi:uncharacterized protein LOC142984528 [Anticarsia gemmatalis]|uniref:uncharacterized protein LOC142984528 n=1 Tax=Anticarsia gemmatalis TaxID=129554 RepID=UPI003F75CAA5
MLVSPSTEKLKSEMLSMMRGSEIFVGMNAVTPGHYYTLDGISICNIPHVWAPKQPDNKNNAERCLTMSPDGKLSDVKCEEPRPYLCYRKDSKVDVNACGTIDPEYKLNPRTKKCYKLHEQAVNFEDAHFACSAEGGHLAIINSAVEANVTREVIAASPDYSEDMAPYKYNKDIYLGFLNWGYGVDEYWMSLDGQPIKAAYMALPMNQPNHLKDVRDSCGSILRSGLFNTIDCEAVVFNFLCEKDPAYPPVCTKEQSLIKKKTPDNIVIL